MDETEADRGPRSLGAWVLALAFLAMLLVAAAAWVAGARSAGAAAQQAAETAG